MIEPKHCQEVLEDGEICGAVHRTSRSHRPGMSREEHAIGAKDWRSIPRGVPLKAKTSDHVSLTGSERAEFARQRNLLVGETITQTQPGGFFGMTIERHIRGSQYEIQTGLGMRPRYAHHKKQSHDGSDIKAELAAGWSPWRQDWHDRGEAKRAQGVKPDWDALTAMDDAVRDTVAQEDEAATLAPPTPSSDQTRVELKAIRLEGDASLLWVVFDVAGTLYHGALKEFDPSDLIKREDES